MLIAVRGLLLIIFLNPVNGFAQGNLCEPSDSLSQQSKNISSLSCQLRCDAYYKENKEALPPAGQKSLCEQGLAENLYALATPTSCAAGVWQAVLDTPERLKAYGLMLEGLGSYLYDMKENHLQELRAWDQDPQKRASLAREISDYYGLGDNPAWQEEAQKLDIVSLLDKVRAHKEAFKRYCETALQKINSEVRSENLEPLDHATQRYKRLDEADPKCVVVLQMGSPDQEDFKVKNYDNFLGKIGQELSCHSAESATELACEVFAAAVVDPSILKVGSPLKTLLAGGLRKKMALRLANLKQLRRLQEAIKKMPNDQFNGGHKLTIKPNGKATLSIGMLRRDQQKFMVEVLKAVRNGSIDKINAGRVVGPEVIPLLSNLKKVAMESKVDLKISGTLTPDAYYGLQGKPTPKQWADFDKAKMELDIAACAKKDKAYGCAFVYQINQGKFSMEYSSRHTLKDKMSNKGLD